MMTIKYQCRICQRVHDYAYDATLCCVPRVKAIYYCSDCGEHQDTAEPCEHQDTAEPCENCASVELLKNLVKNTKSLDSEIAEILSKDLWEIHDRF